MLDDREVLDDQHLPAQEAVEGDADGGRGQLGLDTRAHPRDTLGPVALDLELAGEMVVDGLDRLAEVVEYPSQCLWQLDALVAPIER